MKDHEAAWFIIITEAIEMVFFIKLSSLKYITIFIHFSHEIPFLQ